MHTRMTMALIDNMNRHDLKSFESSTTEIASPEESVIIAAVGQINNPVSLSMFAAIPDTP